MIDFTTDKNGWISVCEHLPEQGQECFVFYKNIETSWSFTKYSDECFLDVTGVTHWRPIFKDPE